MEINARVKLPWLLKFKALLIIIIYVKINLTQNKWILTLKTKKQRRAMRSSCTYLKTCPSRNDCWLKMRTFFFLACISIKTVIMYKIIYSNNSMLNSAYYFYLHRSRESMYVSEMIKQVQDDRRVYEHRWCIVTAVKYLHKLIY